VRLKPHAPSGKAKLGFLFKKELLFASLNFSPGSLALAGNASIYGGWGAFLLEK
jgi:hypothetical protein